MTIRPQSHNVIALPETPSRRSVADLISLWESRAGVAAASSKPVVESGSSTVAFDPKAQSPEARDNSLFVGPTVTRPKPSLLPVSAASERPVGPTLGLPKPSASDTMMLSVAPNHASAAEPSLAPLVTPAPVASSPVTNTASPVAPASIDASEPLQGGAGLASAVTGPDGLQGALASAEDGKMATALSNLTRNAVTAPFQTMSAILDGPRKIGDTASAKGRELVKQGDEQGGLTGAVKVAGGALAQALGGACRLAQPLVGMALMAGAGPVGWVIGAILLGLFVLKEAGLIINNKVDEMQTVKALRDVASGVGAMAGLVLEPIARPLMSFVKGGKA